MISTMTPRPEAPAATELDAELDIPGRLLARLPETLLAGFERRTTPEGGHEFRSRVPGRAARCRLRWLRIESGKERRKWAAFFYKPSAVPHSGDRYAYGAAVFDDTVRLDRVTGWFDWLASGLDPAAHPPDVRRALTFPLPEFTADADEAGGREEAYREFPVIEMAPARRRNASELEIELFCRGLRIDDSCALEDDARIFSRTRAGLGSGLELIVPGRHKELWMNVPVEEDFAAQSPYRLVRRGPGDYRVVDDRGLGGADRGARAVAAGEGGVDSARLEYAVRLPHEPAWYRKATRSGTPMSRVGVLQGTYLGIYISNSCGFWYHRPEAGCHFCTTGLNVGVNEVAEKAVDDVVDVARAAREESGNTFVHFNSGFHGGGRDLEAVAPYVKAVKEQVGALIGVQVVPTKKLWKYDWMIDMGANHFSFCYEFHNPEYFARYLPGKDRLIGQDTFFRAMEYTARKLGPGAVSGEIIAGVEPLEDTRRAIDYIVSVGAFPTVCIFRPTIGAAMEHHPSPPTDEMIDVMRYLYDACRKAGLPIGMAPNIDVSLIVNPEDARELAAPTVASRLYEARNAALRATLRPYFAMEMRPRKVRAELDGLAAYDPATPGHRVARGRLGRLV
jgi:hypothetical protein